MKTNLTRSEKIIAITAFVAISIFFVAFLQVSRGTKSSPQFDTGAAIDYTMARPDQSYSEYTLEGRELEHTFEGLPTEKTEAKLDKKKQELIAKKVAEAKKKEEIKKKQAAVKAQLQAQSQAQLLKERLQTQQLKTQSVSEKNKSTTTAVADSRYNNFYAQQSNKASDQQNTEAKEDAKANKKTFDEWREILFSKPTIENLALFVAALRKNEVTAIEYQAMAQDLIDQNDSKLKGLGLMALRSVPSLASLSQLAHLEASALGNFQAYVEQSLNAYLQPQNLQYLNQALLTQNKKLVAKSLNLLSTNLTKFGQGDFSSLIDPRNGREGEVVNFSMSNYRSLLVVLNQLGSSQDQELSDLAQQVASLIQSSNHIAHN